MEAGAFVIFDGQGFHVRLSAEEAIRVVEGKPCSRILRVAKLLARLHGARS